MSKISPVSIASSLPVQVTDTNLTFSPAPSAPPEFADLVCRVRATAEVVEAWICELDAVLDEFPDEAWGAAATASAVLENANIDIQSAIEDVAAAIKRSLPVG
jgi:hypothetical protein